MKTSLWIKSFSREFEKVAIPLMPLAMGAMTLAQTKSDINETVKTNKLENLKSRDESLQLPGSNKFQFEGGNRIDNSRSTAENLY